MRELELEPLTAGAFAPFGVVVDIGSGDAETINEGNTRKFAGLLEPDCAHEEGRVAVHLYRSRARALPLEVHSLERHPLGSQAFWPLEGRPYVVVVAPPGDRPEESAIRGFLAQGRQAIQYHRGTWHHYQVSLEADSDYLVIDRLGPGENCDVVELSEPLRIRMSHAPSTSSTPKNS